MTPSQDVARTDEEWQVDPARVTDLDEQRQELEADRFFDKTALRAMMERDFANQTYLTKPEFLSMTEAGEIVGLSAKTIERVIGRGELSAYKLGGRVRIKRTELYEWIEKNRVEPTIHDI
jgi:excisionase family DNA binding protein